MAHDVFICYAKEDEQIADAVCATLEARDIVCWYAKRDVPFGTPFEVAIIEAIIKSRLMLLVLSSYSNSSPHVTREIQNAFAEEVQVPVIPIRVEAIELSPALKYYLRSVQWLDASTPPLESHLDHLGEYVEKHLPPAKGSATVEAALVAEQPRAKARPTKVRAGARQKAKAEQASHGRAAAKRNGSEELLEVGAHLKAEEAEAEYHTRAALLHEQRESEASLLEAEAGAEATRRLRRHRELFKNLDGRGKQTLIAASVLLVVAVSALLLWSRATPGMTAKDHFEAGNQWARQQKWDRAEAEYKNAIQMDGSQALWHHHLGDALYNQQRYEGAEAAYKRAVELDENNADFNTALALTLMQREKWADAATRLERVVSLSKNDYRWWNKLGVCYYTLQRYKDAENAFRRVLELVKDTPKNFAYLHINLGDALYAQRNWAEAVAEYREGVRIGLGGNAESDKATYQERLDAALKAQTENPSNITPHQLVPRNYKS